MAEQKTIVFKVSDNIKEKMIDYYELLQTIKEIRLSERRRYQKITNVFETTSIDYNKDSEENYTFFKIVQNKLHYAEFFLRRRI